MEFRKTEKSNLENKRTVFFLIGLVAALGVTYASFNIKSFVDSVYDFDMQVEEEIIDLPPVTTPPPPPPPPPPVAPPPVQPEIEIVDKEIKVDIDFDEDMDDLEIPEETAPEMEAKDEVLDDVPLVWASNFPHFTECKDFKTNDERHQCTQKLTQKKIMECFVIPDIDREMGINDLIVVQFVIDRGGNVTAPNILKGINERLDKEAVRCVNKIPKMIPGSNLDKPTSVQFNLPLRVSIQ